MEHPKPWPQTLLIHFAIGKLKTNQSNTGYNSGAWCFSETANLLGFSGAMITRVYQKTSSKQPIYGSKSLVYEVNGQTGLSLDADGLQQQKSIWVALMSAKDRNLSLQ